MALVINTNIASMNAQKNLSTTQQQQSVTFQRLSTGLRVNSAKDDAAGLYLAQAQTKDIRGLNMATRNAGDGISMAQTAEGALDQIGKNLQRINELAIQSANGSYNDAARGGLQKEVDELTQEINRIVETTEFNGQKLLSKDSASTTLQIGFKNDDGSMIKTGLEGGLVAQGEARKFSFEGSNDRYFTADQANAVAVPKMAQALFEKDKDPIDIWSIPGYTAVAVTNLQTADETDEPLAYQISEGLKQVGNGGSFTVDGMTFTRQSQAFDDDIGQQLKIEFNGKETTVDSMWDSTTGALTTTTQIATTNFEDLFGTAGKEATYALANEYFGYGPANSPSQLEYSGGININDLKVHTDEGLLSALKGGESVTFEGITYSRVEGTTANQFDRLQITSEFMNKAVEIDSVFNTDSDTLGVFGGALNFAPTDFEDLFGNAAQAQGVMSDLLTGDLSATKVVDISTQASAQGAIEFTREAIDLVSELRATFGAVQNRFEAVISGNQTYSENLSAARSRIEDADFAQETANLAKQQVLQQAGVAALGQANASTQAVLGLL